MSLFQRVSEGLARKTSRRGLFGRGAQIATGALIGAAAGWRTREVSAGLNTQCNPPGPLCPCGGCHPTGICAKPCIIMTVYYASGCWMHPGSTLCCDCDCNEKLAYPGGILANICGCASDYHGSQCP